mmetsp:Transcript_28845/g.61478  ORF Transcript_28845/g.61478 Transcript_28845/m.61478 type:complete len:103 (-) Transcript_28845:109-417(-)
MVMELDGATAGNDVISIPLLTVYSVSVSSFVKGRYGSSLLLCVTIASHKIWFGSGQMVNLGIKPYTSWIKAHRGKHLANAFPQYDAKILTAYSETFCLHSSS